MLLAWTVMLALPAQTFRANPEEISALRKRIAREEVRNRFLREKGRSLDEAVAETEASIRERLRSADALEEERTRAVAAREAAKEEMAVIDEELSQLRKAAGRRAAAMRRLQRLGPEAFYVGIEDTNKARRTEDRLTFVLRYDAELSQKIREVAGRQTAVLRRLEKEVARIEVAKARSEVEAWELSRLKAEREVLREALRNERRRSDTLAGVLTRAARSQREASVRIRGRSPPPPPAPGDFGAQRRRLPWPAVGRVEVSFGAKVHPSGVVLAQTGIDLRATEGDPVRAVFAGNVVASERVPGFGRVVILEHPTGYFTVMGHLSSFAVDVGARVHRGQVVGTIGASDSRKGAYLYFEIRRGTTPLDPLEWLHP